MASDTIGNEKLQEEQEALTSIYADEWKRDLSDNNTYSIQINPDVNLYITVNQSYPTEKPPIYTLLAPTLSKTVKDKIAQEFDLIYLHNRGEPILFQWIEKLKEIVEASDSENYANLIPTIYPTLFEEINFKEPVEIKRDIRITHGPIILDRKSTFQGHVCDVNSIGDIEAALDMLFENKKILQATHNIRAYVITPPNGIIMQDCDNDGETHAGGRLLHLLKILKVTNVFVVVSRWYGGIQLGPDRFRHINNAARQALQYSGHIKD